METNGSANIRPDKEININNCNVEDSLLGCTTLSCCAFLIAALKGKLVVSLRRKIIGRNDQPAKLN